MTTLVSLALGIAALAHAGPALASSLQLVGTPGRLTVSTCATFGVGKSAHTVCYGSFRSDNGAIVDPQASIDAKLPPNATRPVQRASDGTLAEVGVVPSAGWTAVIFLGVLALSVSVVGATAIQARDSSRGHFGEPTKGTREHRLLRCALTVGGVALGGALLSGLTAFVARLAQ
nr:hypothetical protein [Streptacidiphilus rugosus]